MIFANLNSDISLGLCINMDGLPLFNSTKHQLMPILVGYRGRFERKSNSKNMFNSICLFFLEYPQIRPSVIAIWYGEKKPVLNEYLGQFVSELIALFRTGIIVNNHKIKINIKAFICDTPARAYVKGITQ